MIVHYLDSSAWVKRYILEPGSNFIGNLFLETTAVACSTLGAVELTATFARKRKSGELTAAGVLELQNRLSRVARSGFRSPRIGHTPSRVSYGQGR